MHLERPDFGGHVNIPLINRGKLGGFFWSIYMPCPKDTRGKTHFTEPHWLVRDTLEQIDGKREIRGMILTERESVVRDELMCAALVRSVTKLLISKYPETFQLVTSATSLRTAFSLGKVSSLLGMEGSVFRSYSLCGEASESPMMLTLPHLSRAHMLDNSLATLRQYYELGVRYRGFVAIRRVSAQRSGRKSIPGTVCL